MDELGRVVIPKELRRTLQINEKDPVEIFVEDEKIILQKYRNEMTCAITGEITSENKRYGIDEGSIVLSPKGAEILLEQIGKERSNLP